MTIGLDHIGVAVNRIDQALPLYEQLLGLKLKEVKESKTHQIKAAILTADEAAVELIEPLDKRSSVAKFLEKRGPGIHHIAFRVANLQKTLNYLKARGVVLIDETPRTGIEGGKMAFLHPRSTGSVLIELCELRDPGKQTR